MLALTIAVQVICGLTALLALYYAVKDLAADLVLLGAAALVLLIWAVLLVTLVILDLRGGTPPDAVLLYGYLLSALALPLGAGWLGVWERTRYGSIAILVMALTEMVLMMRVEQLWPAAF